MNIIEIQGVTKRYASQLALDNVSISIPEGSIFGLLGPNGAGKTSLIRIINQITAPDEGKVLFCGEKLSPSHVSMIGYLPEERGLYKKMEVGEQAIYLAQLKGLTRKDAIAKLKSWFEKFEMQSWWKKKIEELSKGMQQKVQFIVTMIHEPRLLILDEPFTGFDPINTRLITEELLSFRSKGATIILSTHRMESVEELCSHIALINKSKKILDGTVKEIRAAHKTNIYELEYSGNVIGFSNALGSGFELVSSSQDFTTTRARVKMLGDNTVNNLLHALIPHVQIHGLREIVPGMNEIFINKVNG